jgi:general L-amino acid transport system substrate-binding protein
MCHTTHSLKNKRVKDTIFSMEESVMSVRFNKIFAVVAILVLVTVAIGPGVSKAQTTSLLQTVLERGTLKCGVNPTVPGFGFLDSADNTFKGFDPDFCRALASALFGDPTKVEFIPIAAAADRFPKLVAGEIDVLIRNTTFTAGRDTTEGADFAPTTYYDASTIMVRTADDLTSLESLKDLTVCVIKGTTNERAISEAMAAVNTPFQLVSYDTADEVYSSFAGNRCDAVTSDRSQLAGRRSIAAEGADWTILPLNLTKEPLGPAVKSGDSQWLDVVSWTIYATFIFDELGVTQANVDDIVANTTDPELKRLLGVDGEIYKSLGLDAKWAYNIVKNVGNYGEIFDRNLGPDTPIGLERGINNQWTNGGLLYAPPYR